jgi:hypothetical protein
VAFKFNPSPKEDAGGFAAGTAPPAVTPKPAVPNKGGGAPCEESVDAGGAVPLGKVVEG